MQGTYAQEELLRNVLEDAWAVLRMTGYQVVREHGGLHHLVLELTDENDYTLFYTLENGHFGAPDGHGLCVHYAGLSGPVIFTRYNLPGDTLSWQQKAVEPALEAIQAHRSGFLRTVSDNASQEHKEGKHDHCIYCLRAVHFGRRGEQGQGGCG